MDWQQGGSIAGYAAAAASLIGSLYAAINHKRIRSNCCGKHLEASLDVENTTPTGDRGSAPALKNIEVAL